MPIVLKSVTQKKVMQDFLMEFDNIIELYIPDNVLRKLKPGISSIGTIYSTFERLI
ncbi:MAG: hypothetical protein JSW60_07065 [Thermoplasmatales archaeon]|nr:MAG: hypothetical protein JSW60_07065 [Thermoplasmatales archaeon]